MLVLMQCALGHLCLVSICSLSCIWGERQCLEATLHSAGCGRPCRQVGPESGWRRRHRLLLTTARWSSMMYKIEFVGKRGILNFLRFRAVAAQHGVAAMAGGLAGGVGSSLNLILCTRRDLAECGGTRSFLLQSL